MEAIGQARQLRSEHLHVRVVPVRVRLALERIDMFDAKGAGQVLVVPDDVAEMDREPRHEPERQPECRVELSWVRQDLLVAGGDHLDPERRPVHARCVPAHDVEGHELVDRAVTVDDEMGARAG